VITGASPGAHSAQVWNIAAAAERRYFSAESMNQTALTIRSSTTQEILAAIA